MLRENTKLQSEGDLISFELYFLMLLYYLYVQFAIYIYTIYDMYFYYAFVQLKL